MYKNKSNKKRIMFIASVVLIVALTATVLVVRSTYRNNLNPISTDAQTTIFTIQVGSSVSEVASSLKQRGLIKSASAFEWYVRTRNVRQKLQAGSYAISPSFGVEKVVDIIITGKVATDLLTILPSQRLDQIQASFVTSFAQYGITKAEVDKAFDPSMYAAHPALTDNPANASLEGYLYPESFQRTAATSPQTIITASLDQMAAALTPEIRAGIAKQGLTVHEGVILASIIENETSNTEDKQKVAQVFLKRLKTGMKLQSDPTAYYASAIAGVPKNLAIDSPYNTYVAAALPPGPISNVSTSSLRSVANPATTDYLYFVAGDDGVTYFSKTLSEHEALTAQHCKKLCQ